MSLTSGPTGPQLPLGKVIKQNTALECGELEAGENKIPFICDETFIKDSIVEYKLRIHNITKKAFAIPIKEIRDTHPRHPDHHDDDPIIQHKIHGTITDPQPGISFAGYAPVEIGEIIYFILASESYPTFKAGKDIDYGVTGNSINIAGLDFSIVTQIHDTHP